MNTIKRKAFLLGEHVTMYYNWWYWVASTYVPPASAFYFG